MRLSRALAAALLLVPVAAAGQTRPNPLTPAAAPAERGAGGIEFGASSSLTLIFPGFGGHVAVPLARRLNVEVAAEVVPWQLEDGNDAWYALQVQLRMPFRERPRARRSLVVGLSTFTVVDAYRVAGRRYVDHATYLRPHAGVSWHWQQSPTMDLRLDLQGVVTNGIAPYVAPRIALGVAWHRPRRVS